MVEMGHLKDNLLKSIKESLGGLFASCGIDVSFEISESINTLLRKLFTSDTQGAAMGALKKTPPIFGDKDNNGGIFNVMPSTNMTNNITDTLVVYCMGNDNLLSRFTDMLIAVGKYKFNNVIFITTKWDSSVVTGSNAQRLQDLWEFKQMKTNFCFVLVGTCGIIGIPLI